MASGKGQALGRDPAPMTGQGFLMLQKRDQRVEPLLSRHSEIELAQAELAARMRTSQSTVARLESGQTLPSTKTLLRYAEATGSKFHVRLSAA
jgi:predicted transcriptional regulator